MMWIFFCTILAFSIKEKDFLLFPDMLFEAEVHSSVVSDKMFKSHDILSSKVPLLFKNLLDWEFTRWSFEEWKNSLGEVNVKYPFRRGCNSCSEDPVWESNCDTSLLTMSEFFDKFSLSNACDNTWLYFDYKHISSWFSDVFKDITWRCIGFPERGAKDSTLWIGTEGAHTPCHMDSYGCNIVAQLYGKKMWLLFDPSESNNLSPTRVPYEESSVYSNINFACTCHHHFPDIKKARCIILEPGDILYVPNHWWHYVENVTSAISVNTWIPVISDNESRVDESLVKCFIASIVKELDVTDINQILNPNERDLTEFKTKCNIDELSYCVHNIKKVQSENETKKNNVEYLNDFTIPTESLHNIIKNLRKCKIPQEIKAPDNKTLTVKHLINAFCHPDVIANVKKKLYSELSK